MRFNLSTAVRTVGVAAILATACSVAPAGAAEKTPAVFGNQLPPTITVGTKSPEAHALNQVLNINGYYVDSRNWNTFDATTLQELKGFQVATGLAPSGIADAATWNMLLTKASSARAWGDVRMPVIQLTGAHNRGDSWRVWADTQYTANVNKYCYNEASDLSEGTDGSPRGGNFHQSDTVAFGNSVVGVHILQIRQDCGGLAPKGGESLSEFAVEVVPAQ